MMKRTITVLLMLLMLVNTCVFAEDENSTEDDVAEELLEMIIDEEEFDEDVPVDIPIPASNGDDIYLAVSREGEDAENSVYIHFSKPAGTLLGNLEDNSASAFDLKDFQVFEYLAGDAAINELAETDDEGSTTIRDGGEGVTAWINADGESAGAVITLPAINEEAWFLLVIHYPLQDMDVQEHTDAFKNIINEEIDRLQNGITIETICAPADIELEDEDEDEFALRGQKKVNVKSVKLDKTTLTLKVQQEAKLKATISPSNASNKKVSWSSSNKKVATVNGNGVVVAKGTGTATITVTTNNGKKATCKVTVQAKPAVNKVSIKGTVGSFNYVIMRGKPVTLVAVCSPSGSDQTVTWSTSNSKVATVSSKGVVTPKGYGSCTITAKSQNGKTATCRIEVLRRIEITKCITQVNDAPIYWKDYITIYVDGLTGKIIDTDCWQDVNNWTIGVVVEIEKLGIKVTNKQSTYVEFKSSAKMEAGAGFGKFKGTVGLGTQTWIYRLDVNGNLTKTQR